MVWEVLVKKYIAVFGINADDLLFTNKQGQALTRQGIGYILKKYAVKSKVENPSDFDISGKTLYDEVLKTGVKKENVHYFEEPLSALPSVIQSISSSQDDFPDGFLFVTMGAGDNWKLGKALIEKF